jgi:hypothetical protein
MSVQEIPEGADGGFSRLRCPICGRLFGGPVFKARNARDFHVAESHSAEEIALVNAELGTCFTPGPEVLVRPGGRLEAWNKTSKTILADTERRVLQGDPSAIAAYYGAYCWSYQSTYSTNICPERARAFLIRAGKLGAGEILPGEDD